MSDTLPTGEEPEEELDPEALADELDLGIDLSPEEQAAAEEMVAHLQAQFADEAEEVEDDAAEEEPEVEEETEEEVPTEAQVPAVVTTAATSARGVVIDGVEVPVEEAVAYLTKREAQRQVAEQAPPPPAAPQIPEWLDQDDPAQMAMWTRQQDLERRLDAVSRTQAQTLQEQTKTRAVQDANAGISTFRQLHPELSEEDIGAIRTHAAALEIIDGLAKTRSGSDAVAKALDIAYKDLPEFQARETGVPSPAQVKKAERAEKKSKLNALGGSSGSVPRSEARPDLSTDSGAKAAAAQWLREQNILPN